MPLKSKMTKLCSMEREDFGGSFVTVIECPVHLTGRDLLCALGVTFFCTEMG